MTDLVPVRERGQRDASAAPAPASPVPYLSACISPVTAFLSGALLDQTTPDRRHVQPQPSALPELV